MGEGCAGALGVHVSSLSLVQNDSMGLGQPGVVVQPGRPLNAKPIGRAAYKVKRGIGL